MLTRKPAPTDQRAGVRPLSFVLDNGGSLGDPVLLPVRPEDLSRNEPSRVTVHQTLGRGPIGWADDFGEGLPSVTISGHTGWRQIGGTGLDGVQSFLALNNLVVHELPAAKQAAINSGRDPAGVKLIFVDLLDHFTWSVVAPQFVLRRSKSRPLLFQYNITLQAIDTAIDSPFVSLPNLGGILAGQEALARTVGMVESFFASIETLSAKALSAISPALAPIAATVKEFVRKSNAVFAAANRAVDAASGVFTSAANAVVGIAGDLAKVGANVFNTFNKVANLPQQVKAELGRVAAAYNELMCLFANSLRSRGTYEEFSGLYGASNCSSTTGGKPASQYANQNVFALTNPPQNTAILNTQAAASVSTLARMDPVLAPMPPAELGRHLTNVVTGIALP